jgi:hypothetical protein
MARIVRKSGMKGTHRRRAKKAAVTKALPEFVARTRQKGLLDLMGKLEWDSSYDYKAERGRD